VIFLVKYGYILRAQTF